MPDPLDNIDLTEFSLERDKIKIGRISEDSKLALSLEKDWSGNYIAFISITPSIHGYQIKSWNNEIDAKRGYQDIKDQINSGNYEVLLTPDGLELKLNK
ncbi:MAG: hypothetical protein KJ623_01265 [Nanoarchaeota archaeon]|nr:hypothetical protein [Nanoarchaeota archaeon]MBU0962731.1 hypothetical protein [Nanoarchaeota archaeon]